MNSLKKSIAPVSIARGETLERVIFKGSRKPMDRRDLHVALEPIMQAWIRAACLWETLEIGDYRFVVFSLEVAPETQVYVQFWSEPLEPVVWEISSGRWNPPADEWLAGERASRIEALGFPIGGKAENYHRIVRVTSAKDTAAIAKTVVRIFYSGFDYRGTAPILAKLVHEGRSETNATFDAFTIEDISKVFAGLGFRVEALVDEAGDEERALIRCRNRGTDTTVELHERVGEQNLYRRLRLAANVELPEAERRELQREAGAPDGAEPVVSISVVHPFSGGVTLAWLMERIKEWDAVLAEHRRAARRERKKVKLAQTNDTVH